MVIPEMVTILPLFTVKIRQPRPPGHDHGQGIGSWLRISCCCSAREACRWQEGDRAGDSERDRVVAHNGISDGDRLAQLQSASHVPSLVSAVLVTISVGSISWAGLKRADVGAVAARHRRAARQCAQIRAVPRGPAEIFALSMAGLPVSTMCVRVGPP